MTEKRVFNTPVVVASRCISFDPVRYNGDMIPSHEVEMLKPFVRFIPVCPEVEIGLGIPRAAIRIIRDEAGDHLVQPSTGEDLTDRMNGFCRSFLDGLQEVDGFILKNRSPTSGIAGVNIYKTLEKSAAIGKDAGFFGRMVLKRFTGYPIEDEGRIKNYRIRDHFLTRIFMLADLDQVLKNPSVSALSRFHRDNNLMLMAYSQTTLKTLGHIIANQKNHALQGILEEYKKTLIEGTRRPVRYTSHINVLLHALGYFSSHLSKEEKAYFLELIEGYRTGTIPVIVLKKIIQGWIIRFNPEYLKTQTYFAPYPDSLVELESSLLERGRDMYEHVE